jgi:hemerythrin
MPLLIWKQGYSVNEAILDSHHQKLFSLLNTAYENVMNSLEVDSVLPIIEELSEYTRYHFAEEEQYLREKGFQEADDHIAQHGEFTRSIESLKAHYHGNNLEAAQELIVILGEWLLRHVIKEDRKYAELSAGRSVRDDSLATI